MPAALPQLESESGVTSDDVVSLGSNSSPSDVLGRTTTHPANTESEQPGYQSWHGNTSYNYGPDTEPAGPPIAV